MSPSFETSKSFTKSSRFTTKAMDTNYNKNNDDSNETSQPLTDSQLYEWSLLDAIKILKYILFLLNLNTILAICNRLFLL